MAKLSAHGTTLRQYERIKVDVEDDNTERRVVIACMSDGHLLRKTGYKHSDKKRKEFGWYPKGFQMTAWKLWKRVIKDSEFTEKMERIYTGLEKCGFEREGWWL